MSRASCVGNAEPPAAAEEDEEEDSAFAHVLGGYGSQCTTLVEDHAAVMQGRPPNTAAIAEEALLWESRFATDEPHPAASPGAAARRRAAVDTLLAMLWSQPARPRSGGREAPAAENRGTAPSEERGIAAAASPVAGCTVRRRCSRASASPQRGGHRPRGPIAVSGVTVQLCRRTGSPRRPSPTSPRQQSPARPGVRWGAPDLTRGVRMPAPPVLGAMARRYGSTAGGMDTGPGPRVSGSRGGGRRGDGGLLLPAINVGSWQMAPASSHRGRAMARSRVPIRYFGGGSALGGATRPPSRAAVSSTRRPQAGPQWLEPLGRRALPPLL